MFARGGFHGGIDLLAKWKMWEGNEVVQVVLDRDLASASVSQPREKDAE